MSFFNAPSRRFTRPMCLRAALHWGEMIEKMRTRKRKVIERRVITQAGKVEDILEKVLAEIGKGKDERTRGKAILQEISRQKVSRQNPNIGHRALPRRRIHMPARNDLLRSRSLSPHPLVSA
jgi:hypothetical protein